MAFSGNGLDEHGRNVNGVFHPTSLIFKPIYEVAKRIFQVRYRARKAISSSSEIYDFLELFGICRAERGKIPRGN